MLNDINVYVTRYKGRKSEDCLRKAVSMYLKIDVCDWKIEKNEYGKPYFTNHPEVNFSISHSGDFWACAFSEKNVGLDIQQHVSCNMERISKRFLCQEEDRYLSECHYDAKIFFDIWTCKESYVKLKGKGLAFGLDTFNVLNCQDDCTFKSFFLYNGYSACVCAEEEMEIFVREF